jgi:hypothetical protein
LPLRPPHAHLAGPILDPTPSADLAADHRVIERGSYSYSSVSSASTGK